MRTHFPTFLTVLLCLFSLPADAQNQDTIFVNVPCGEAGILCTSVAGLQGNFSSLSVCQPPANGDLVALNDTCMVYQPDTDFHGDDSTCLLLCDDLGACDTFLFDIFVEQCPQQFPCVTIPEDSLFVSTVNCSDAVKFCIEFPLGEILNYDFDLNGSPYNGNLNICAFDTIVSYGFSAIPGNGMNGPYEITSWVIDGNNIGSGTFDNVFELVDLMNMLDPDGNWALDSVTFNISSFNTLTDYGQLTVQQQVTGDLAMLNLNSATAPTGSALYFPTGIHEVIMTHQDYSFCVDTFTAFVHCSETVVRHAEILVGGEDLFCPVYQLPGSIQSIQAECVDCEKITTQFDGECLSYRGLEVGTDSVSMVACDEFGFCDTTWLIVTVKNNGLPVANIDLATTTESTKVEIPVLDNDVLNGALKNLRVLIDPVHGQAVVNASTSIIFSPDVGFCGLDAFAYEICNEIGCDTSAVEVEVLCTRPVVYTGFSPNGDGVNDFFKITNLDNFPDNKLLVFNRWGNLVFHEKRYGGKWDGRDVGDSVLPDGTYFYQLHLGTGQTMSGFVQIHR